MVRDLAIDINDHDLLFADKSEREVPLFDTVWGELFEDDEFGDELAVCNILIPAREDYLLSTLKDDSGTAIIPFRLPYTPDTKNLLIRPVFFNNGIYDKHAELEVAVRASSYVLNRNVAAPIKVSQLPLIDIDGEFVAKIVYNDDNVEFTKAYIYSAKSSDIDICFSDTQSSQLLSICNPGNHYRYPTTGIGISSYLNSVIEYSDLKKNATSQFEADGKPVKTISFDQSSGELIAITSPEKEKEDSSLIDPAYLDLDFFKQFTDDFIRQNIVLDKLEEYDFLSRIKDYDNILGIYFFPRYDMNIVRAADSVVRGRFAEDGSIVPDNEHYIVSATLEAGTIIMFNDSELDAIDDTPVFRLDDENNDNLYTSLIGQPYWISQKCRKCFVLRRRSKLSYVIEDRQYNMQKGLFVVPPVSANLKNILCLAQGEVTGKLMGIVSDNSNISDAILEEVTGYIYSQLDNNT